MEHRICENPDGSVFYLSETNDTETQEQTEEVINIPSLDEEQSHILEQLQVYRSRVKRFSIFDIIFSIFQYIFFTNNFFIVASLFNIWVIKYQRDLNSNYKTLMLTICFLLNLIRILGLILFLSHNYILFLIPVLLTFSCFYAGQIYNLKYLIYCDTLSSHYRNNTIV